MTRTSTEASAVASYRTWRLATTTLAGNYRPAERRGGAASHSVSVDAPASDPLCVPTSESPSEMKLFLTARRESKDQKQPVALAAGVMQRVDARAHIVQRA